MSATLDIDAGLRRLGYQSFRPGQREAVETLLSAGRLLLVAPTGGGKSLSYQLPAVLLPGTTLVISPLVALMNDQVQALNARGVPATMLASTLDGNEIRRRMARMAAGEYSLVYAAPERIVFPGFRGLLKSAEIPLVAIDEAHCISEWGHDFRPEYLEIGGLLADLPKARVLACTATATPVVRDEILSRLGLPADTPQHVNGFARPNLKLRAAEVEGAPSGTRRSTPCWPRRWAAPGKAQGVAIVYAPTRRGAEEEGARLGRARVARRRLSRGPGGGAAGKGPARVPRGRAPRSWSPPTPSGWASTARTCARSCTWRPRDPSRPTTRRSAARAATAPSPAGCCSSRPTTCRCAGACSKAMPAARPCSPTSGGSSSS